MTYWDEPADRPFRDPSTVADETVGHYQERIRFFQSVLDGIEMQENSKGARSDNAKQVTELDQGYLDNLDGIEMQGNSKEARSDNAKKAIERYQGYLDNLLARKRAAGEPIPWDCALPDDVVAVLGDDLFGNGQPYRRQDLLVLCHGDELTAGRLAAHLQTDQWGLEKLIRRIEDGGYEQYAYDTDLDVLRTAAGGTLFNRVLIEHGSNSATEIVFGAGLDVAIDENDWEASLEEMREWFQTLSRIVLHQPVSSVVFSPTKPSWLHGNHSQLALSIEADAGAERFLHAIEVRSDPSFDLNERAKQEQLREFFTDLYDHFQPSCRVTP
ncbi:hypothetical protein [Chromobacterium haemolyticum]|uniref:hypothetical protein n=1 Tax=Chromobacterium haemolyticum TaxID=394935 RepID=UPI00244C0749|nr:hypothetical protein [Chromobacterium haemolyticum]MDH0342153.1 hypothetical protein [Chromobacterium haemolyticum]